MVDLIIDQFEAVAQETPDQTYMKFLGETAADDRAISYEDANARASGLARVLLSIGVGFGDSVGIIAPNCINWLISYFAIQKIGAVACAMNSDFCAEDLASHLTVIEARVVIGMTSAQAPRGIKNYIAMTPDTNEFLVDGKPVELDLTPMRRDPRIEGGDAMSIVFTSGTTGTMPKAVLEPHGNLFRGAAGYLERLQLNSSDSIMMTTPVFHASALNWGVSMAILCGGTLLLAERFRASLFWEQTLRGGATGIWTLAAIPFILLRYPVTDAERAALKRIHFFFAAGCGAREREVKERWGSCIYDGWGMSETFGSLTDQNSWGLDESYACLGTPVTGMTMAIADTETGEILPAREHGEIVSRHGEGFIRYFGDPSITDEALRNGWFRTGDIGYRDEHGRFFFVDRLKDIIRRGGENISSREIETALATHPSILEVHALPAPDTEMGETVCVFVVLKPGVAAPTLEDIRNHAACTLAKFKLPELMQIVDQDDLPRTPSGRVRKNILKAQLREQRV
jgi:acyl-CoA synthetase (AMP-forming)/AMP-acid ligase II